MVQYLPEKELKSCRLVCSKWYFQATKVLQNTAKAITFGDLYKVNLIRLRPDLETIKLFISTMDSSEIVPYSKFDLRPSIFSPKALPLLEEFLNLFGPIIETLTISLAYESADTFTKRCFPYINLCNLKSLDFCNTIQGEMRPSLRTDLLTTRHNLLETILNAAPNLETLNFWCDSENLAWPAEAIDVLRTSTLPTLRNLKISFPMTNYQLINLSKLKVQLSSFTFLIREPIFNTQSFYQILESQCETLTNLKIVDLQCDQFKFIEFPKMNQLKNLEIEGTFYGDNCKLSIFNFTFKKVPRIEKILLRNCHGLNFDLESLLTYPASYQNICQSLQELHVTLAHDFFNAKWVREIGIMFPNLKNMHIMFSAEAKDILVSVFQYLTHLHCLTINVRKCGENIDNLLTGITAKTILEKQLTTKINDVHAFNWTEFTKLKTNPSLTDLKRNYFYFVFRVLSVLFTYTLSFQNFFYL